MNHGLTETRIYKTWCNMKTRCFNKSSDHYKYYGGKGIVVCNEWKNDFLCFYNWAMSNGYTDELTIDRLDNSKGYCPGNCKWSNIFEQANNKTTSRIIVINGESHTVSEWARIKNVKPKIISDRIIRLGWDESDAVVTPVLTKWNNRKKREAHN